MNNKPTITYIKNGKEKIIKHFINLKTETEIGITKYNRLEIYEDVEYIHFNNYKFSCKNLILDSSTPYSKDIILILEDCIIDKYQFKIESPFNSRKIYLQLINCTFLKETNFYIKNIENIDINLSNEGEELNLNITECNNITINSSSKLNTIYIDCAEKIHIRNFIESNLDRGIYIFSIKLILEDCLLKDSTLHSDELLLKRSKIETQNSIYLNQYKITLENSSIITNHPITIPYLSELIFNDQNIDSIIDTSSYLQAEDHITLGEQKYQKETSNQVLVMTYEKLIIDKSLKRQELISILKDLIKKLRFSINEELQEKNEQLSRIIEENKQEKLEKLNQLINVRKKQIAKETYYLKEQASKKIDKEEKYLLTKKISTYTKNN